MNPSPLQSPNNPAPTSKKPGSGELIFRAVIVVLLLASVVLIWWSYNDVYAPRLKASRDASANVASLSVQVDDLENLWPKPAIAELDKKFDLVDTRLFSDQSALEGWLSDLREELPPLGLDIKATFEKTIVHTASERKLLVIPTTIYIELLPVTNSPGMPSSYQRLLQLTQKITLQKKRADLTELSVESGTNSVGRAVVGLNFWAGGKD